MKLIVLVLAFVLMAMSCKKEERNPVNDTPYTQFGEAEITAKDAVDASAMLANYKTLQEGDTVNVKFKTTVNEVCQKKGCWMMAKLSDDEQVRVTFKDYGFFVPMNAAESEAVVQGKAFLNVTTVDQLKHFAEDAGKTAEEIETITEPEVGYGFVADAVMLR